MTQQEQHEVQLRLSCLSLAAQTFHLQPERVLEAANEFYNYAIGTQHTEIVHDIKKGDIISIPQEI